MLKKELLETAECFFGGAVAGYLLCLARHRVAASLLVLLGKAEARILADVKKAGADIKADVAVVVAEIEPKPAAAAPAAVPAPATQPTTIPSVY